MNKSNIFDFFDEIVCINLDISRDRKKHSEYYFDKLKIPAKFFTAKKHKKGGMYGCFDSHIQIIQEAYDNNIENILVFEDDFLPTSSYSEEKMEIAISFMKKNQDWDIFHLGYSFIKDTNNGISSIFDAKKYNEHIIQYNPFCTQALCYNRRGMEKILENYKDYIGEMHYDMFISSYCDMKNYCIIPMLFDQNFYFQHNNESNDLIEYLIRGIFPLIAFTKFNYRMSLIYFYMNKGITRYKYLYLCCIIVYLIKYNMIKYK